MNAVSILGVHDRRMLARLNQVHLVTMTDAYSRLGMPFEQRKHPVQVHLTKWTAFVQKPMR